MITHQVLITCFLLELILSLKIEIKTNDVFEISNESTISIPIELDSKDNSLNVCLFSDNLHFRIYPWSHCLNQNVSVSGQYLNINVPQMKWNGAYRIRIAKKGLFNLFPFQSEKFYVYDSSINYMDHSIEIKSHKDLCKAVLKCDHSISIAKEIDPKSIVNSRCYHDLVFYSSPLRLSVSRCDSKDKYGVMNSLIINGANLKEVSFDGESFLHLASSTNKLGIVKKLLNIDYFNSIIDKRDYLGYTALALASYRGYPNVVQALIDHNANSAIKTFIGASPLLLSKLSSSHKVISSILKSTKDKQGAVEYKQAAVFPIEGQYNDLPAHHQDKDVEKPELELMMTEQNEKGSLNGDDASKKINDSTLEVNQKGKNMFVIGKNSVRGDDDDLSEVEQKEDMLSESEQSEKNISSCGEGFVNIPGEIEEYCKEHPEFNLTSGYMDLVNLYRPGKINGCYHNESMSWLILNLVAPTDNLNIEHNGVVKSGENLIDKLFNAAKGNECINLSWQKIAFDYLEKNITYFVLYSPLNSKSIDFILKTADKGNDRASECIENIKKIPGGQDLHKIKKKLFKKFTDQV